MTALGNMFKSNGLKIIKSKREFEECKFNGSEGGEYELIKNVFRYLGICRKKMDGLIWI